jgi:hypothetical protein
MPHALIFGGAVRINGVGNTQLIRLGGSHKIATWLRSQDWDVEVVDYFFGWTLEELQEFCKLKINEDTIFIGYSATFATNDNRLTNFISWFRSAYPAIKIIAGGQDVILTKIDADYYLDGYSEYAINAVINHIRKKEKLNYTFWNNGKLIKANISYPAYPMATLPIRYEDRDYINPYETLPVELSRGCKFKCAFCNYPILGVKGDYSRDASDFKEELTFLYEKFGVTKFNIADETINDRTEKLEKFANVVQQLEYTPWLNGFIRFDLLVSRRQDWDLIAGMNLFGHHYGIETLNWESGKAVGKGMNPNKIKEGLIAVRKHFKEQGNYRGLITLIAGLPYETKDTLSQTLDWMATNWAGEGIRAFPLGIPKMDGIVTTSTISNTYKELGYSEMSPEELEVAGITQSKLGQLNFAIKDNILFWKNEHMNFFEAEQITNKWHKANSDKFLIGGWNIGELAQIKKEPLEELLKFSGDDVMSDEERNPIIRNYIDSKLGYSK